MIECNQVTSEEDVFINMIGRFEKFELFRPVCEVIRTTGLAHVCVIHTVR